MKNTEKNQLFWLAVALAIATGGTEPISWKFLKRVSEHLGGNKFSVFGESGRKYRKKDLGTWHFVLPNWWLSNTTVDLVFTPNIGEDEPIYMQHMFDMSSSSRT